MQAQVNYLWAETMLRVLAAAGVKNICLAAGSRSSPLVLSAVKTKLFTIDTHYDERALAYLALGITKVINLPVAIIVTSGTAVANCLPAVVEANNCGNKLIVISADRPIELINCGANQAIEQKNIFADHAISFNLPSPNPQIDIQWLITSIKNKIFEQDLIQKPLHINIPFPEPLYLKKNNKFFSKKIKNQNIQISKTASQKEKFVFPIDEIKRLNQKKIILVIGNLELSNSKKILDFANKLACPVFCDIQSGVNNLEFAHYDLWLANKNFIKNLHQTDLIIQFGGQIVSNHLLNFIKEFVKSQKNYWLIDELKRNINPNNLPQKRFYISSDQFLLRANKFLPSYQYKNWFKASTKPNKIKKLLDTRFTDLVSECSLAYNLHRIVGKNDLFIGNSLIIRILDKLSFLKNNQIFTNRGASGIDGILASAIGVQKARKKPLFVILGDHSFLYDLNSLVIARKTKWPLIILLINNNGGAIFDFFPIPQNSKEKYYTMPHNLTCKKLANQFDIEYDNPQTISEIIKKTKSFLPKNRGTMLIELIFQPKSAYREIFAVQNMINKL